MQTQPTRKTEDSLPPVDVPAAPATETLPPRRWKQVNLYADPPGCNLPRNSLPVPAGCRTAGPPGHQRTTTQAVTNICSLFVPGIVAGKYLNFLVDTACAHNLSSRTVFDRLPAQTRQHMVYGETVEAMVNAYIPMEVIACRAD